MEYRCPVKECTFSSEHKKSLPGHIAGHKRRGEVPRDKRLKVIIVEADIKPEVSLSSAEVADTLLKRVVKAINDQDFALQQFKEAKARIYRLEEELSKVTGEKDRILKIHNDLVKRGDGDKVSTDELLRLATAPPSKV